MFDHVVIGVSNYQTSRDFFLKALEPLGVKLLAENDMGIEMSTDDKASLCLFQTEEKPARLHIAFVANSREQVNGFYQAALAAGATDNGGPGLRPQYSGNYYAAFVIAPDGHNVEAVYHEPDETPN